MRKGGLDNPERRINVGLHGGIEIFARNVENRLAALLAGRVADHDVKATKALDGVLDQLFAEGLVPNVTRERNPDAPLRPNDGYDLLRIGLFAREIIDRHVRAFTGVGYCSGATHSGITPSDKRLAPCEPCRSAITRLAVIGRRIHFAGKARPRL